MIYVCRHVWLPYCSKKYFFGAEFLGLSRGAGLCQFEGFSHSKETENNPSGANVLTTQEVRIAFSQAQSDTELNETETSELVFAEFVEGVARLALAKWETDVMRPAEKVGLDCPLFRVCTMHDGTMGQSDS